MKTSIHLCSHLTQIFLEWEMFQTKFVEKIKITKATNMHFEYVIFIALPLQQWLRECTLIFHFMYIACLVYL